MAHNFKEKIGYAVGNRLFELIARISLIPTLYLTLTALIDTPYFSITYIIVGSLIGVWMIYHYSTTSYKMYINHQKIKTGYQREFLDKQVKIEYEVGSFWDVVDRFKEEEKVAVVLGVNNRFCLDDDYLSKTSLISDYMMNVSSDEREKIGRDIESTMIEHIKEYDQNNKPIYKFGSLFLIQPTEDSHYEVALLSMCEPSASNLSGRFASTRQTLIESFEKLFEQMPGVFTDYTLIIPLIGTKSSGSPLSQEEVAKFLISAFANYSRVNQNRLAKRLIISLYDKDFKEMKELMKIKNHIDMEADKGDFSYSKLKSEIEEK